MVGIGETKKELIRTQLSHNELLLENKYLNKAEAIKKKRVNHFSVNQFISKNKRRDFKKSLKGCKNYTLSKKRKPKPTKKSNCPSRKVSSQR